MKRILIMMSNAIILLMMMACQKDGIVPPGFTDDPVEFRAGPVDMITLTGFQPEGIVIGKGNKAYIGGFFMGGILKANLQTGDVSTLVPSSPGIPVIGLTYDQRSDIVFAAGGNMGTVRAFNGTTGDLEALYQLIPPGSPFDDWINDLVVTREAVYVTNSLGTSLYRIPLGPAGQLPETNAVEEIPLTGEWVQYTTPLPGFSVAYNANGIDATPDGNFLVIANSASGLIYRVDPESGYASEISINSPPLFYADGIELRPCDNCAEGFSLYIAQSINTVVNLHLDAELLDATIEETIIDPRFDTPSTLGIKGSGIYVVNARFATYNPFMPNPGIDFSVVRVDM